MRYTSTRQTAGSPRPFSDILLEGLAPDGGLYVPERYPRLSADDLEALRRVLDQQGYAALATRILAMYIDDIPEEDIAAMASRAYSAPAFSDPAIVPVTALEGAGFDLRLAHLSLGPTAAFKDMAMQLLGELFEYELSRRGQWLTIVGATSGDTGSAAEYALRGRDGLSVVMLTPAGRMTAFQRAQMFSLLDDNIVNVAVDGVFDDCQALVKSAFVDADLNAHLQLTSANSINVARFLPQAFCSALAAHCRIQIRSRRIHSSILVGCRISSQLWHPQAASSLRTSLFSLLSASPSDLRAAIRERQVLPLCSRCL